MVIFPIGKKNTPRIDENNLKCPRADQKVAQVWPFQLTGSSDGGDPAP